MYKRGWQGVWELGAGRHARGATRTVSSMQSSSGLALQMVGTGFEGQSGLEKKGEADLGLA